MVGVQVEAAPLERRLRAPLKKLARRVAEELRYVDSLDLALRRWAPRSRAAAFAEEIREEVVEEAAASTAEPAHAFLGQIDVTQVLDLLSSVGAQTHPRCDRGPTVPLAKMLLCSHWIPLLLDWLSRNRCKPVDSGHHPLREAYPFLAVCNAVATIEPVAGHDHDHGADRRMLAGALALIVGLLVAEIAVGILAGSLALLADAGHMLTDAAALALALVAAAVAQRPPGGSWTFGFRRVEILAALANGITLALVGIWIVYEAVRRLISPTDVRGGLVIALAVAGILVNLGAAALLLGPSRKSLNVRGAFLHVTTDLAAFAGTAVAGALILVTGWDRFDPLASLAVAGLIFWSSAVLLRESSRILLDVSPGEMPPDEVAEAMLAVPDVVEVHDLHVWTVGSGFPALSAHVLVRPEGDCHEARRELAAMLSERFGLQHTTLQVEHARQQRPLGTELPLARG